MVSKKNGLGQLENISIIFLIDNLMYSSKFSFLSHTDLSFIYHTDQKSIDANKLKLANGIIKTIYVEHLLLRDCKNGFLNGISINFKI